MYCKLKEGITLNRLVESFTNVTKLELKIANFFIPDGIQHIFHLEEGKHCWIEKLLSVPPPAPVSKICQQIGCSCDWFSHFFSCMKAFSGVTLTMSRPGDQHLTFDPLLPSDWGQNVTTHYWHFPGISALIFASITVTRMTIEYRRYRWFPVDFKYTYQYISVSEYN